MRASVRFLRWALPGAVLIATLTVTSPGAGGVTRSSVTPVSASFTSSRNGWVLARARCGAPGPCQSLWRTGDGGRTWSRQILPASLVRPDSRTAMGESGYLPMTVVFANDRDGWIYGSVVIPTATEAVSRIWSTHDGGVSWRELNPRVLGVQVAVLTLAASRTRAYLIGTGLSGSVGIWSTALARDDWRRTRGVSFGTPAGGSELQAGLVFRGGRGWAVVGNDRGVSGAWRQVAGTRWRPWDGPCHDVGDSYSVPVAVSATRLEAVCTIGGFGGYSSGPTPPGSRLGQTWLYNSTTGGATFRPARRLHLGRFARGVFDGSGLPMTLSSAGLTLAAFDPRAGAQHFVLIASENNGRTWRVSYRGPGSPLSVSAATVSARWAYVVAQTPSGSMLLVTRNGGASWVRVRL